MGKKPIWFGYKVWCLNLEGGYLYDFEVYQGKGSQNEYTVEFGVGPRIVLGLLQSLPQGSYGMFIENYFTPINLLKKTGRNGYWLHWDNEI